MAAPTDPTVDDAGSDPPGEAADDARYPAAWEADVLLRDGHPVHLRPITPADGDELRRFHGSLSDRTVYFRFFSAKPALTDQDVRYFTHVDHHARVAFVAVDAGRIVGVGRFDAIGDGRAEVAFVIRDDMQGLGLGSVLLEHLAAAGRERGIRRFVAEVLPENARMLATFREAGYELKQRREEDVIAVGFDIEPTATSVAVMEAREQRAEARSVHRLLHPQRVAVVGASRSPGGLGHALLANLVRGGFTGDLVAVHPEVDQIAGVRCVRSLSEVGEVIDLAVVVVPAERVGAVIEDAELAGVHGLIVVSGGFGDAGAEGLQLQAELVSHVHRTGMRLVGPNALGIINTDPQVRLNASLVPEMPPAGRIGFFSQSGALAGSILERFRGRGLGLSTFVSAGNRADISGNDLLQFWEEDADTDLVLLYLETIGNARKFARIIHRISGTKPVVMVRAGGAEQRHPLGHAVRTTELGQEAVDQLLGDCGLIVVDSIDQQLDVARLAGSQPLPLSERVAIISNSDALAVMAVNACHRVGLTVAGEPVTFARQESAEAYRSSISRALDDPSVGSVLAVYVPPIEHPSGEEIRSTLRRCASHDPLAPDAKPVVALMIGDAEPDVDAPGDVPSFGDVEDALQALSAVTRYATWRRSPASARAPFIDAGDRVELPAGELTGTDGASACEALGLPLRTGAGADSVEGRVTAGPGLRIQLVEDPLFGPVVIVGVDDPVAERLDDRGYRLAPVTAAGARSMLGAVRALPVAFGALEGDQLEAVAGLVHLVSAAQLRCPELQAIDLRHVQATTADGIVTAESAKLVVGEAAVLAEPAARRM